MTTPTDLLSGDDPATFLAQPGRWVYAPTDLSTAFPHGGTALGKANRYTQVDIIDIIEPLVGREHGEPYDYLYTGTRMMIRTELLQWNDAVLQRVFPGMTTAGGTSGDRYVSHPTTSRYPGILMSALAVVLLFSPEDLTTGKVLLLREAIPVGRQSLRFGRDEITRMRLEFVAVRDSNDAGWEIGDRRDLSI